MEIKDIYKKLENQCPSNYRINEIIPIAYPYRRIRINATVNKSPEESIQQVYAVFIRAIKTGLATESDLTRFLGLDKDDFILRELYFLRERGYLDLISGKWMVTAFGENFIKDNSILKILSEEVFEFYVDAYNNEILPCDFKSFSTNLTQNKLEPKINLGIKSPDLLIGKTEQIVDIYKKSTEGKAYLIDYNVDDILFDKKEYNDYYLIEYVPTRENENEVEPRIEIRNTDKDYSLNKRLTKILSEEYPAIMYQVTESERAIVAKLNKVDLANLSLDRLADTENRAVIETLSIWETKAKFMEAIKNTNKKLLIESPWIKSAALGYIPEIEAALKRNVTIFVLYGIQGNDEHDIQAVKKMEQLEHSYDNFRLIHLPTHFHNIGHSKMVGSHKKLVIKDNDYYLLGSFNFLSFNKNEGQKVANEETLMISLNVDKKWETVLKEYTID